MNPQYYPYLVLIPVVAIIVFRNLKPRRLRLEMLWVRPVIIAVMAVAFLAFMPFPHQAYAIPVLVAAAVLGIGLGYMRGRMVRVTVDPENHTAMSQSSPLGVLFILAIVALKVFIRPAPGATAMSPEAMLLTDALLLVGAGTVGAAGVEVWLRARRMIADSRARAGGTVAA